MSLPKPQNAQETDLKALFQDVAIWDSRAAEAQAKAAQAYGRLLNIAETSDAGQAGRVAQFLASTFNGYAYPWDLFELRAFDVAISDDMLVCLDALRWGKADLFGLVPDGEKRVKAVVKSWGINSGKGGE